MRTTSILYQNEQSLQDPLDKGELTRQKPYLIRIYTSIASKEEAAHLAEFVRSLFPKAQIIGASASGIIYRDEQYTDQTMILFDEYENAKIHTARISWKDKPAKEAAGEAADFAARSGAKLMHVLCSDHYYDVHSFVKYFNLYDENNTILTGGVVGDVLPKSITGYVFDADGVADHSLIVAALGGERLHTYHEVNISHEAISEQYTVTRCDGPYWKEVDGEPAEGWLREQLGIQQPGGYSDWQEIAENDEIIRFPMILENHHGASRFLKYDSAAKRVSQYFSRIPENTTFRIGYTSPTSCVKRCYEICADIGSYPIESLFVYTCLFRRLYLNNCAEWELSPFKGYQLCGAFMMGEICNIQGANEFLNGACCLIGTAEHQVYIRPDSRVFEKLNQIEDDKQSLLNFVLKKQSEAVSRKNEYLLSELLKRQMDAMKSLYTNVHVGIGNYIKYKEERKLYHYDKLCMIRVENSEALLSRLGQDRYFALLREGIAQIKSFRWKAGYHELLTGYILNDETFFLVSRDTTSEKDFMKMIGELFERFQLIRVEGSEEIILCRFAVVLHQEDMVESALNTLHANRHQQTAFLVCDSESDAHLSSHDEFKIIGVLNRALENDGIVPYFQGIYDNRTKHIQKYEALMRIVDVDGTVYLPAYFMDTAKKYHLYTYLSKMMYQKVFQLFSGRQETVSLNFSAHDINSDEMQSLILDNLKAFKNPSHLVVEILEDEPFNEINTLQDFVSKVREYGVKIAIDDFGAGYSNFVELAYIRPDYIKVDGSIVRNIPDSAINQKLLQTVVFMGKQFDIEIVAEYVENQEIQCHIADNGIQYSQGYYFSEPAAFEDLHLAGGCRYIAG